MKITLTPGLKLGYLIIFVLGVVWSMMLLLAATHFLIQRLKKTPGSTTAPPSRRNQSADLDTVELIRLGRLLKNRENPTGIPMPETQVIPIFQ